MAEDLKCFLGIVLINHQYDDHFGVECLDRYVWAKDRLEAQTIISDGLIDEHYEHMLMERVAIDVREVPASVLAEIKDPAIVSAARSKQGKLRAVIMEGPDVWPDGLD